MKRSDGERTRLKHSLSRLRSHIESLETALTLPPPVGAEAAQGIAQASLEVAMQIAKLDAYVLAEEDAEGDTKR